MHMLIEVYHLKAIELAGNLSDLLLLVIWDIFDTWCIPLDVCTWSLLILSTSFDGAIRYFAIANVFAFVVAHGAYLDLRSVHLNVSFSREAFLYVSSY
jgi:hypothetical protein